MNYSFSKIIGAGLSVFLLTAVLPAKAAVNVTQEHNNLSRDGVYVDSAFTPSAAANLTRDLNFNGTIVGNVLAQPLFIEGGPNGPMVIAVTESNNVYALNAITGTVIWQRNVGPAVPASQLPCGTINPLGISDTPAVDLPSRALFFDAMTSPDGGATKQHLIFSLNVDTGATNPGWPVNVNSAFPAFNADHHNNRGAIAVVNGIVYVPYSGHNGDCLNYHGWVVGVQINNPAAVVGWTTNALGGGIWGHSGVASDGTNLYVVTGNTFSTGGTWGGGEAIVRLQAGPVFTNTSTNYWAPTNWLSLDNSDTDLGGCSAMLIDVPGATPSQLVLALGKDRNAYLLNRNNLGGIVAPVNSASVSSSTLRGQSSVTYRTSVGTYFAFRAGTSNMLVAYRINPTNPPTMSSAWLVTQSGEGTPFVTTTNGTDNFIVWSAGAGGSQRLNGYNADTGGEIFSGGGANELMTGLIKWNTGIAARGRIYYAANNKVYAFRVPVPSLSLSSTVSRKTHGAAGDFDISMPGVECRSGGASGDYTLVFTFSNNIESGNASVTSGIGSVSGTPTASGNTLTVNLTGVTTPQTLTVTLNSVTDQFLQVMPNMPVSMTVLVGDTSNNNVVNATDIAQTKGQIGLPVTGSNFRTDLNANGAVNGSDVSLVKAHSGESASMLDSKSEKNRVGPTK
ncbi:MAG: dockerin type I domain-containing protein [Verrucomicrobiota bacterium]